MKRSAISLSSFGKSATQKTADNLQTRRFPATNYNLRETLASGQAFRWRLRQNQWIGVIQDHWVKAFADAKTLILSTNHPQPDWKLLKHYFQIDVDLAKIIRQFPPDPPLQNALAHCRGLRLLRQNPWETLASFLLSSNKQISHIAQIIEALAQCFQQPILVPKGEPSAWQFPPPEAIADTSERRLRRLKMGYRAPYLREAAKAAAERSVNLTALDKLPYSAAKETLIQLPGVGPKIADCVLLFAYGKQEAFPMDVWVKRALEELYFQGRRMHQIQLQAFAAQHFAPFNGYAQQYLFHFMRTKWNRATQTNR